MNIRQVWERIPATTDLILHCRWEALCYKGPLRINEVILCCLATSAVVWLGKLNISLMMFVYIKP